MVSLVEVNMNCCSALAFVTNVDGMPLATPKSVFLTSACACRKASLRLAGYVRRAALCSALACKSGCSR